MREDNKNHTKRFLHRAIGKTNKGTSSEQTFVNMQKYSKNSRTRTTIAFILFLCVNTGSATSINTRLLNDINSIEGGSLKRSAGGEPVVSHRREGIRRSLPTEDGVIQSLSLFRKEGKRDESDDR